MPRSLNEPVWLTPHCLTHRSSIPSDFASRGAGRSGVKPSPSVMMFSGRSWGRTHSCFDQTPDVMRPTGMLRDDA